MKQGYIHLLPYMLQFLAGTRRIVRYHDVTPGSQITWNTAFLAVTGFVINRLNVSVTGMERAAGAHYVPSVMEITVSIALIGIAMAVFALASRFLPIFPESKVPARSKRPAPRLVPVAEGE